MEFILESLLAYLISLAAGLRSDAISEGRRKRLKEKLEKEASVLQGIQDRMSLTAQLRLVGTQAARFYEEFGMRDEERPLVDLLAQPAFQDDLAKWLTSWWPEDKETAVEKVAAQMAAALKRGGDDETHIKQLNAEYFERIEKIVFSDPVLSTWRQTLAFNALFEGLETLGKKTHQEAEETRRLLAEKFAQMAHQGVRQFTEQQRVRAVERYRELALESCDIIDLANLPEDDRHIATQQLALRRLYVPLRVKVEFSAAQEWGEQDLKRIEKIREEMQRKGPGKEEEQRSPVGERLAESRRLVLLGDPGAGKTTLLRWIATAYLLRLKNDPAYKDLPDVKTLPEKHWLPIIIRCRDLDESCKTGTIDDVLCETFRKAQLTTDESSTLQVVMREQLAIGKAILLVDGLDEITNVSLRARFCQQIERVHIAFPKAPVIVTSRIVGYREMGYRIGRGFEHATVAEFSRQDKDQFARRWCDITEVPERKEKATEELIRDIHSADRIERLTGNPMLLTTMALVKRKVGKLPSRRADLYWEAVLVLLNWRSEVDEPIDHREAVPQLEYVAYEMCSRGVQRLREDEIVSLLAKMREEYPHIRPITRNDPETFLKLLERRTGILIEAGEVRHMGRPVPVFEFRHLTFQEYLAALALVDGRFPGRDKNKTLAGHIAPLAGQTEESRRDPMVKDNWREVLRLCTACCGDDDVDDVLMGILTPIHGEDFVKSTRPRAMLAALCLADEPNVGDDVAQEVLRVFSRQVVEWDVSGHISSSINSAVVELAGSEWEKMLRKSLVEEFCKREVHRRSYPGSLCGMVGESSSPKDDNERHKWFEAQVTRINSGDQLESNEGALIIMQIAYKGEVQLVPGMVEGLLAMLDRDAPSSHAGAWALRWLVEKDTWSPTQKDTGKLIDFISNPLADVEAVCLSIKIVEETRDPRAVEPLLAKLNDKTSDVRKAAIYALGQIGDLRVIGPLLTKLEDKSNKVREAASDVLGQIGDPRAMEPLLAKLEDQNSDVREAALAALAKIGKEETDQGLLSKHLDGRLLWLDPQVPIDEERIREAAAILGIPKTEVRSRYQRLAEKYGLKLKWKRGTD